MNSTNIQKTFKSTKEILDAAEELVSNAPDGLKNAIKPYFISRYFVALFEARHGEIPIQVWNEYRNAFDHLFRFLVSQDTTQIKDVEKHLLRAALDILKLYIHTTSDTIKKEIDSHKPEVLRLVDNGDFLEDINSSHKNHVNAFESAKVSDLALGNNSNKNGDVLRKYLDTAFEFKILVTKIDSKAKEIRKAQQTYDSIHDKAHKHSFFSGLWMHMITHWISIPVLGAIGLFLMWLAEKYEPIKSILSLIPSSHH